MLRRIEKVLEQVRQTTRGRVPFHERPLQGYFFFFFSNSIRLTKKTETANINKLKRERISLSGRGECQFFTWNWYCLHYWSRICMLRAHYYWPVANKFYRHEIYKRETIVRDRPAYLHRQSGCVVNLNVVSNVPRHIENHRLIVNYNRFDAIPRYVLIRARFIGVAAKNNLSQRHSDSSSKCV